MSEGKMSADLIERLRGIVRIPITDGMGPAGGEEPNNADFFVRTFPTSPLAMEAAAHISTLQREADEAREQVAARDKIIDQLRASHAEEAREWDEHRTAYINDCVRLARAAGFELDDAPEAIADLIVRKRRDSQREADGMREALTTIANFAPGYGEAAEYIAKIARHALQPELAEMAAREAALNVSPQDVASQETQPKE